MKKCPFCGNEPKHHEGDDYVLSHDPECFFTRHYAQEMWLVGKRHVDQWSARQDEENPTSDPEAAATLLGHWRHAHGMIFCGTLRIARADFDTNPSTEIQDQIFSEICTAMNELARLRAEVQALREDNNDLRT